IEVVQEVGHEGTRPRDHLAIFSDSGRFAHFFFNKLFCTLRLVIVSWAPAHNSPSTFQLCCVGSYPRPRPLAGENFLKINYLLLYSDVNLPFPPLVNDKKAE